MTSRIYLDSIKYVGWDTCSTGLQADAQIQRILKYRGRTVAQKWSSGLCVRQGLLPSTFDTCQGGET